MGFFDGLLKKIPFVSRFSKKKEPVNNVELQFNKAMNLMDNGDAEESVNILEQVADIGIMDAQYKSYGDDALLALAEFYEKGKYRNAVVDVDLNKSTKYYEKYVNQNHDGDVIFKLAKMLLEVQNFSKAIKYYELAATDYGIKAAYMSLGSIYESGLNRVDEYGNKSDYVVPIDLDKAMMWYKKLADTGDAKAKASFDRLARDNSLTGLEFASGIPGTIGGAVYMNAGAYGGEMKDVVTSVKVMDADGHIYDMSSDELDFSYRHSAVEAEGLIVLEVTMKLAAGVQQDIDDRMKELSDSRRTKQPLEYPSAGSTFKRPEGYFAGKLIMDAGLRGYSVGGAQVSEKHCGFVVNRGGATAADVTGLIRDVQKKVMDQFGVMLEPEVKMLGDF